jgi:hypothetical protein
MNKKELYKHFISLESLFSEKEIPNIMKAIEIFSPLSTKLKNDAKFLLDNNSSGTEQRNIINGLAQEIIKKEKLLKYRNIIIETSKIDEKFNEIKSFFVNKENVNFIYEIEEKIDSFLNYYEEHTRNYSSSTCISLSFATLELSSIIKSSREIIHSILFTPLDNDSKNDLVQLDLYLSNVKTLKEFGLKLDALADIYSEVLVLYGENETDNPVIIEHLENGSLWIKIAGHSLTSVLLTSLLTIATDYYHNNFTQTGKISNLPLAVDIANNLLKITEKLEKDGIDTSNIKTNIESATRKISKKLDILLSDQPIVEINNFKFDIGQEMSMKLIENQKIKQIENKNIEKPE